MVLNNIFNYYWPIRQWICIQCEGFQKGADKGQIVDKPNKKRIVSPRQSEPNHEMSQLQQSGLAW